MWDDAAIAGVGLTGLWDDAVVAGDNWPTIDRRDPVVAAVHTREALKYRSVKP